MAGVDAELRWGDERLEVTCHSLDAVIDPSHGPFCLRPFERDGDDYVLTIPARADALIRTANGMRDMATLRVLGHLAPHPDEDGGALIRLRRLRDAEAIPQGVVLTDRIEAWLGIDGWWLRVSVDDGADLPPLPRFDRRSIRRSVALSTFVVTLLAGVLTALGAVPPRVTTLDVVRPIEGSERLPLVEILPPEHASPLDETKQDVMPRAVGGGETLEVWDRPALIPARQARPLPLEGELGPAEAPEETEAHAASWQGPADGYGGGLGRRLVPLSPHVRFARRGRVRPEHCRRTWTGRCRYEVDDRARRSAIARVVRRQLARVRRCYERGLAVRPGLAGHLVLRWSITANGAVRRVAIGDDELGAPGVTECVRQQPHGWRFPSWVGPAEVSYPLSFRAAEVEGGG